MLKYLNFLLTHMCLIEQYYFPAKCIKLFKIKAKKFLTQSNISCR